MVERLDTDILILGAGGAGLLAAIHAARADPNRKIALVVKGLMGKCGCTRMVQGGYNVAVADGDSVERHFMDTIAGGKWLPAIAYAIQGGLTAEEILSRTLGSVFWGSFYTLFVMAAGVHAAIGLRTVLFEWTSVRRFWLNVLAWAMAGGLVFFGLRAVFAVTMR